MTDWEVEFFAPAGSQPIGKFHPLLNFHGSYSENELLDTTSLEGLTSEYFITANFDFVLDYSAIARNIEEIRNFYGFQNYGVFRNGYSGYAYPRLKLKDRHYILPSEQNKQIFEKHGFTGCTTIYYGVPDFYCPRDESVIENEMALFLGENKILPGLDSANYFLFPHRPTEDKGASHVIELAKEFPYETFVFMVSNNPVQQHKDAIQDLRKKSVDLPNVKYVELPLTNKHHYFKRELMRHAKAILSPFNPAKYLEGFGLANAEAVACGTPLLISDSPSSRELWREEIDALIIPYDDRLWGFKETIKHFSSYNFDPKNRYTVDRCIKNYEAFMNKIIESNNVDTNNK